MIQESAKLKRHLSKTMRYYLKKPSFERRLLHASNANLDLQNQIKLQNEQWERMKQEYKTLKSRNNYLGEQLERVVAELESARLVLKATENGSLANSKKTSDGEIQSSWKRLSYNIRSLANLLASYDPADVEAPAACNINPLSADQAKLLQNDEHKPLVIERWLWKRVASRVFKGKGAF